MSKIDIEKIIDMIIGAMFGMAILLVSLYLFGYFAPHQCSSPKAYTLQHEIQTSDGLYRYEMHGPKEQVGMLVSGVRIEHGFMINTNVKRHIKRTKSYAKYTTP